MTLENCPNCEKKLAPPFQSTGRQVCVGCGWSSSKIRSVKKSGKFRKSIQSLFVLISIPIITLLVGILAMEVLFGDTVEPVSDKDREFDRQLSLMLESMNRQGSDLSLDALDNNIFVPRNSNLKVKARKLGRYYCSPLRRGMDTSTLYSLITSDENYKSLPESKKVPAIAMHAMVKTHAEKIYCPEYSSLKENRSKTSTYRSNSSLYESDDDYKLCVDTIIEGGGSWSEATQNCREFKEKYDPNW